MSGLASINNIGAFLRADPIIWPATVTRFTSDGAPNATEVLGLIIDRTALGRTYNSAKIVIAAQGSSTGGMAATVLRGSVVTRVLHATSTAAADFAALGSTAVTTNFIATGTSTNYTGMHVQDIDLRTARRYIQVCVTPTATASSSGVFQWGGAIVFGGGDELPATARLGTATITVTS